MTIDEFKQAEALVREIEKRQKKYQELGEFENLIVPGAYPDNEVYVEIYDGSSKTRRTYIRYEFVRKMLHDEQAILLNEVAELVEELKKV